MAEVEVYESDLQRAFETPIEPMNKGDVAVFGGGGQIETVPLGAQKVAVYRDEQRIIAKLKNFAAAMGPDWYYAWQTKNKDGSKGLVEGPSIDCALYVLQNFGNCDVDVRVNETPTHWLFYARFTDFETGFRLTRAYAQRKSQDTGMKDKDRAADIVFQIGQSKAIRNVVCNALRPFTDFAFDEAKKSLVTRIERDPVKYRKAAAEALAAADITVDRVEKVLGRVIDQWTPADIARVRAELQSVRDGFIPAEDLWPMVVADQRPTREQFTEGGQPGAGASEQGGKINTPTGEGEKPASVADTPLAQEAKARAAAEAAAGGTTGTQPPQGDQDVGTSGPQAPAGEGAPAATQAAETGAGEASGENGGQPATSVPQEGDQAGGAAVAQGTETAAGGAQQGQEDQAAKEGAEMLGKVKATLAEGGFDTEMGLTAYSQRMKVAIGGIVGITPDLADDLKGQLARLILEEKQRLAKKKKGTRR